MAFLTTGDFYLVTFLPTANAAWTALSPVPGVPEGLSDLIFSGGTVRIYVTDDSTGSFVFVGGAATNYDNTLLASQVGPFAKVSTTGSDGQLTEWAQDPANTVYTYNTTGFRYYSAPEMAALKTFLP